MLNRNLIIIITVVCLIILINIFIYKEGQVNPQIEGLETIIYPINSIDMLDTNNSDLAFLSSILKNNRIIFLGEQLHSDASAFRAKGRLIKYLHENLNYDIVLYEAGLYDMWLMNEQLDHQTFKMDREKIPALGLYNFWWDNAENKNLWDYYRYTKERDNPIILGGFDIQLTGKIDDLFRYELLNSYLKQKDIDINEYPALSFHKQKMSLYFNEWQHRKLSKDSKDSLLAELSTIISLLEIKKSNISDNIYVRYLSGLRSRYKTVWKYKAGSKESMQSRDSLMAQNLIWLIDSVYKDKKIIVWTANVHTLYNYNDTQSSYFNFKPLAEYIKSRYGDMSYLITFTSFGRYNNSKGLMDRANNKSIEYVFHQTKNQYFFINTSEIDSNSFLRGETFSKINQGINIRANWSRMTDGIFYIDTMNNITFN
ncbi:erythromycin esterase family protein [Dysgonomonas sp. GY617]|uniref:erythromycin esterase family protein n=1 Tax=Dysgonomonas sp. GY617 TaxID=2780420 RepID=UPI001883E63C|nr:erythromycin esterase family protein [Dysgonomonas sp. GY617]MBF0575459.1 erythromycin esterase family protein [Dysgonomonas sp. GY617]